MKAFRSLFIVGIISLSMVTACGSESDLEPGGVDLFENFDDFADSNTSLVGAGEPRLVYQIGVAGTNFGRIKINATGSTIAYVSDDDPVGTNTGGNFQIFTIGVGDDLPVQITEDDGTLPALDFDMDGLGTQLVFTSRQNLTGDNGTGTSQVFLAATDGSSVTQVTMGAAIEAQNPAISGDGLTIAFISSEDLTGANAAGDPQIFAIDADGANLRQVTMVTTDPQDMVISDNGAQIAYSDVSNPFGMNVDGSTEIFTIKTDGSDHAQLTMSAGESVKPKISDNGSKIVFASNGQFAGEVNLDGDYEIYVASTNGTARLRITDSNERSGETGTGGLGAYDISGDGEFVVFTSRGDLLGLNGNSNLTLYWAGSDGSALTQQIRRGESVAEGALSLFVDSPVTTNDGQLFAYTSRSDYAEGTDRITDKIYLHSRQ